MKFGDMIIAFVVVSVVIMIIIPVPKELWILLTLNITLSLIILLISMYINQPLQFSIFPSLLLLTTLCDCPSTSLPQGLCLEMRMRDR